MKIDTKTITVGLLLAFVGTHPAYAQAFQPVDTALGMVVTALQGTIARSLGVIAVIILGVLAMFGRMTLMLACSIILGIALVFGAGTIVDALKTT